MRYVLLFLVILTGIAWAQDAPEADQTTKPLPMKKKGPLTCEWKTGEINSKETTIASGDPSRMLHCGDYWFSAVIVPADAFALNTRKSASYPITYVLLKLTNKGDGSVQLKPDQFELLDQNGKKLKPMSPTSLAMRVRNGPGDVDFDKGPNLNRSYAGINSVLREIGGTKEDRARWERQAEFLKDEGLRQKVVQEDASVSASLYFPPTKSALTLVWKSPRGDRLVIPAPAAGKR